MKTELEGNKQNMKIIEVVVGLFFYFKNFFTVSFYNETCVLQYSL